MKVLLSGTSNSILARGIQHGISTHPAVSQFNNISFGASGIVAVGDHLRKINFSDFDLCVLDYHVNEAVLLQMGLSSLAESLSNLAAMCHAATQAGCLPIITIFPLSNRFHLDRPFETAVTETLAPFGLPIFNLYPLVARLSKDMGRPTDHFFHDPNHIHRNLGNLFGAGIIDVMKTYLEQPIKTIDTGLPYNSLTFAPFTDLRINGLSSVVQRSTRLLSVELLHCEPGARLTVLQRHQQMDLAGITFNASRSWGAWLDTVSGAKVLESINPNLFTNKRHLTIVALPCAPSCCLSAATAELIYEPVALEGPDNPPLGFEISGLILRDSRASRLLSLRVPVSPPSEWIYPEDRYVAMRDAMTAEFAQQEALA